MGPTYFPRTFVTNRPRFTQIMRDAREARACLTNHEPIQIRMLAMTTIAR